MIKNDASMSNVSIKCRSLTRRYSKRRKKGKKDGETHISHTLHADKNDSNINKRK